MIMADVFMVLFLILGSLITVVCYWLLFEALFPALIRQAQRALVVHPGKSILYGLGLAVPAAVIGFAMAAAPAPLKLVGVILIGGVILVGLLGSTAVARHVGLRLPGAKDDAQPWRRVLRGGIVLSITFVLPFVGWFFVLPLSLIVGIGALAQLRKAPQAQEVAAAAPVAVETASA